VYTFDRVVLYRNMVQVGHMVKDGYVSIKKRKNHGKTQCLIILKSA